MPFKGKKILIFEDNRSIQMILRVYFEKRGSTVKIVDSGLDAVALVKEFAPSLIILDIIMPGKSGLETCMDLRKEGFKTPIVMLSSRTAPEDMSRGLAAGANAYFLKPFSLKQLEQAIVPLLA